MRKLVTIRKVKDILPIQNSDFLECALVDGWQCVVGKKQFKKGDYGVYFEIDSFLPEKPQYEFLRKICYKEIKDTGQKGFKLRTMKFRGVLSQGLLLPLADISELNDKNVEDLIGIDLSSMLDVIKYEVVIADLGFEMLGVFPSFMPKTDAERIQNLYYDIKDTYKDVEFEITVKLDGTSMTVYKYNDEVGVCSRNYRLRENEKSYWMAAKEQHILDVLNGEKRNLAIQGELMGPGIQKNKEKLSKPTFFVFNIFDIDSQKYLGAEERRHVVEKYNLFHVPVLYDKLKILQMDLDEILKLAEGKSLNASSREGIVCKSSDISFKVINNNYLLKEG